MAALHCESFSPFTNQQCMRRVTHHIQRYARGVQEVAHGSHSADTQFAALHNAGVHFNFAGFIQKTSPSCKTITSTKCQGFKL